MATILALFGASSEPPLVLDNSSLIIGRTISNAYVSFGGLLMSLQGPVKKLTPLRVDNVYLLIKK